jgi:hypothetical protein
MDFLLGMALSAHMGLNGEYNELHPHFRLENESFVGGLYYNSMERATFYGGYNHKIDNFFIEGGLATGYDEVSPIVPYARAGFNFKDINVFLAPVAEEWNNDINYGAVIGVEYMIPLN